jgi:hypothetical protein
VNFANGDYHLASNSIYRNAGTDGKDIGCDINALNAAINACSSVPTSNSNPKSEKQQILVYPNPNQGTFHVNLQGIDSPKISVYDVFGRVVNAKIIMGSDKCIINLGDALRGIYLLRIEDIEKSIQVGRFNVK